jgi:hypothetical protein
MQNRLQIIISFIKTHETKIVTVAGAAILLIVIIVMFSVILSDSSSKKKVTTISPSPVPSRVQNVFPTVVQDNAIKVTASPSQASIIYSQVKPALDQKIPIPYSVKKTTSYGEDWAIIEVTIPTTDPANVIVKKENGVWKIKLGPGTSFDPQDLQAIGAPDTLKIGANTDF